MKRLYLTLGGVGLVMLAAAAQNQFRIINLGPSPALTTITLDGSDGSVTAVEFYGDGSNLTGVSGSGDVAGPASSTDNAVVRFDGETGKIIQNSAVTIADTTGTIGLPGGILFAERDDHTATPSAGFGELWVRDDTPNVLVFTDDAGTDTVLGAGGGGGDVTGPAGATDNAVPTFSGTGGKTLQNSPVTVAQSTGNMAGVGTLNSHTIPGGTGTFVLTSDLSGLGDMFGPESSTNHAVPTFDGTDGKTLQNSPVTVAQSTGNMAGVGTLNSHTIPGGTGTFVLTSDLSGFGDVTGPGSSTNHSVARFDGETGKLIKSGVVTIADTSGNMAGVGTINTHTIPGGTGTFALTSNLHDAVTLGGTPDYITISGQVITRALINLATHVDGDLPFSNITQVAQATILGRAAGAGTGDLTALTANQVRTITEVVSSLTSTTNSVAWNSENANRFAHTLTENTTMAANSGTARDQQVVMFAITGAASVYTLAWNAEFVAANGLNASIPGPPEVAGDVGQYLFIRINGASKWMLLSHIELTP
jgi:hypothetical protein